MALFSNLRPHVILRYIQMKLYETQDTPHTPSTSPRRGRPSFSTPCCSFFTRWTISPTASGPRVVQRTIAHVTTRKISELVCLSDSDAKMRWLSPREEMRKPISPRAVIAQPRIDAGYIDLGLIPAGAAWGLLVATAFSPGEVRDELVSSIVDADGGNARPEASGAAP